MRHPLRTMPHSADLLHAAMTGTGAPNPRRMHPRRDDGGHGAGTGDTGDKGGDKGGKPDDKGGSGAGGTSADDKPPADKGFPANTPVAEMKPEEREAYHRFHSRKHEQRASAYHEAVGGLSPDDVKAKLARLDELERENLSEADRKVEDARREERQAAAREIGTSAARSALEIAVGYDPDNSEPDNEALGTVIDSLDLTKLLTSSGTVDAAKVRALAGRIAPADKDKGGDVDFGGGRRGSTRSESSVKSGAERYAQRRGQKAAASTT